MQQVKYQGQFGYDINMIKQMFSIYLYKEYIIGEKRPKKATKNNLLRIEINIPYST